MSRVGAKWKREQEAAAAARDTASPAVGALLPLLQTGATSSDICTSEKGYAER